MAGTTGDKGAGSTEAGSPRPECGRAVEPRSRRPGSGRTAGRGVRSAKSRLVRRRGPANVKKLASRQELERFVPGGAKRDRHISTNVRQIPKVSISGKSLLLFIFKK